MAVHRFVIQCIFILVLISSTCMASTSLTLEQRVEKLEKDFNSMKRKFEAKVKTLETNVTQLQTKVNEQESLLRTLKNERQINVQLVSENVERNQQPLQVAIHRTCHSALAANPSLASGTYWIDPDGQGVGDDPIQVFCNMTSGSTAVLHDSESQMDVGYCKDRGCYSRDIKYSASEKQINALVELSNECHQSIRYDCNMAPLEFNSVAYSWWNDKNGKSQYFWSGNNTNLHSCQCGIDGDCYEPSMKCNCDSALPIPLSDIGIITNKKLLPITQLNFGRTLLSTSSGRHTLGRLECSGQVSVVGMPKSCADLLRVGHTLSGLYSVMGTKQVESVYCDFTKLSTDSGFQKWIGQFDVKSSPVYFYVQRNADFNKHGVAIPFTLERLNIGRAMDLASGIFTAPRPGIYFFFFSGLGMRSMDADLYLNGNHIGSANSETNFDTYSIKSTLKLNAGDKVSLKLRVGYLHDTSYHYTHFTGWLLQEDLAFH